MSRFTYSIKTMGCKANIYDSMLVERELAELGGARDDNAPDLFVLNSCTVTAEADKQCHYEVNHIKKRSPGTWVVVTGCYAQVGEDKVRANENVGLVVTNERKSDLQKAVAARFGIPVESRSEPENDPEIYWGQLPTKAGRTRAFIKIQEGCNDFCTYCIIPYARGKSRSVRLGLVISEIQRLVEKGIREVILTGTNIADYGKDLGVTFEDLVEAIIMQTRLPRLRLSSLDPSEISDRLLGYMGKTGSQGCQLMPHIHVSLQSPVSRVLRAMKRHYRTEEVIDSLNRIHATDPDIFVGMDAISGFPSETREEHEEGLEILTRLPWSRLHVFPYSEREGTPAVKINPSVPVGERRRRAKELMALSHQRHEAFIKKFLNSTIRDVLFESSYEAGGDHFIVGHAPNYMRVMARIPSRDKADAMRALNTLGSSRIVGASPKPAQDWTLEGVFI